MSTPPVANGNAVGDGTKVVRRGTRPGGIRQVRLRLWWAIEEAALLLDDPDTELKLKAINALSTASNAYGNLTKNHTLESEVDTLQKELHDLRAAIVGTQSASKRPGPAQVN